MRLWSLTVTDILFVTDLDGTFLQPDVTVSERTRSILIPLLEHYVKTPRDAMDQHIDLTDMMTLDENAKRPSK